MRRILSSLGAALAALLVLLVAGPGWAMAPAGSEPLRLAAADAPPPKPPTAESEPGEPPPERTGASTDASAHAAPERPIVYHPPRRGSPRERVGGGVRGSRALPAPSALAPAHVGLTTRPSPSLFWYLDGPAPEDVAIVFTLLDARHVDPVVETDLPRPARAGIQRVRLDALGVALEPGVEYTWSIALVPDASRRAEDVLSQGWLRRVDEPPAPDAAAAAERGLWYDALEQLCDAVDAAPADAAARARRRELLRQAGLDVAGE